MAQRKWIWLVSMRMQVRFWPRLVSWGSGVAVSCGVGCRLGLALSLLWLWCRPAAVSPIWPLAQEPPYAVGMALKSKKQKKKTPIKLEDSRTLDGARLQRNGVHMSSTASDNILSKSNAETFLRNRKPAVLPAHLLRKKSWGSRKETRGNPGLHEGRKSSRNGKYLGPRTGCFLFSSLLAVPMACKSSQAREWTWTTAVTTLDLQPLGQQGTPVFLSSAL